MTDSSSSSDDEEEKAKLASAAWPTFSHGNNKTGTKPGRPSGTEQKKSLRYQEDFKEQGDYRNVDATPEMKTFIAKKLTSWLDGCFSEFCSSPSCFSVNEAQASGGSASVAAADNTDDDFHLFSTSKPGLSVKQEFQTVKRKQRPPLSSSDSDSEEEKAKLSSVAVSYDQILQSSSSSWPKDSQDTQVTSNLSPTNPHSTLTSEASSQSSPSNTLFNTKSQKHKGCVEKNGSDIEKQDCIRNPKKKKQKKKLTTETVSASEAMEQSGLSKVIRINQSEETTLRQPLKDFEKGKDLTSEQLAQRVKKKRKKKKHRQSQNARR